MLTGKYLEFYNSLIKKGLAKERIFHDSLTTLAFGCDASFYRLIPKIVIRAGSKEEIKIILSLAYSMDIAVTFRAAGTSLSGQALSDSVLVIVSHGFTGYKIFEGGKKITLEPGIRGALANRYLAPLGRKIGPDPASIDAAMIGGIAANNASGMCCGADFNSYKTVADINLILSDSCELDTASASSKESFKKTHSDILRGLEELSKQICADKELKERIIRKYKIKNTTGYSLNAFVDYSDGFDILKHLIIGSEGTLGFISNITYNTVEELSFKALSLALYPSIKEACCAVQRLKELPVSATELIDRASIRSVENATGVPSYLKGLPEGACGLLIEARSEDETALQEKVTLIKKEISQFTTLRPLEFTFDKKEQAGLWKVRKETLPTVAGMRRPGTTYIIEDICFPVPSLAEAVIDLRKIFEADGYSDAVIFGHALAGNLHFMFNQDFSEESEVKKYAKFMEDITEMVVKKYDGSLKAEHGTGRNMAPFVEKEWGEKAYGLMQQVKKLLDPKGILNPGVILNEDKNAHLKNLKPCPKVGEAVDKCMECGFCERGCPTEGYTLSPRQRVAAFREIKRLEKSGEQEAVLAEMKSKYSYWGTATCATDSLCALICPVKVDNGKLTKELRQAGHSEKAERVAEKLAGHMNNVMWWLRASWNFAYAMRKLLGKRVMAVLAGLARKATFNILPAWNASYPKGGGKIAKSKLPEYQKVTSASEKPKVVYMPSCLTRTMGKTKDSREHFALTALTDKLLRKAGYEVVYPKNLKHLCCGMAFSSKGYIKAAKRLTDNLKEALLEASEGGRLPILCDMSPCLYTMKTALQESNLQLFEPAEFALKYLLPKLKIKKIDKSIAVFAVCTAKKLGVDNILINIARQCAENVIVTDTNCCGFAGDKGFFMPELNSFALRHLREQVKGASDGYSTSRTCEVGLSKNSGLEFRSILYLIDEASD